MTEQTADLVVKVIKVLSNPLMRPLRKSALRVLESIQSPLAGATVKSADETP